MYWPSWKSVILYGPLWTRRSSSSGIEVKSKPVFQTFEIFDRAAVSLFLIASRMACLPAAGSSSPSAFFATMCAGTPTPSAPTPKVSSQSAKGLEYSKVISLPSSETSGKSLMRAGPIDEESK
ncbi:Uncharacterised protein [Mycobacteroides abscessus subsp. abscessus]|nr:Uncharacterised protein [Mycobacteroides abscessus subsp. abscessus]